jgi:hypothetical protein
MLAKTPYIINDVVLEIGIHHHYCHSNYNMNSMNYMNESVDFIDTLEILENGDYDVLFGMDLQHPIHHMYHWLHTIRGFLVNII